MYNNSGEEYEDAQVRLVVGKINLVEKIAQLARIPMQQVAQLEKAQRASYCAARRVMDVVAEAEMAMAAAAGHRRRSGKPKEIIKEGLSEYFIYTIEGTETIPNGWSKRMRSFEARRRAVQDPVPLPRAGVRRSTGADVPADQRQGVEAGHHALARRHGPRLPRQRPRRAELPDRPERSSTSRSATRSN